MYEELLIGLRGHAKRKGCDDRCPCYDAVKRGYATCSEELAEKAADAIEELSQECKVLYAMLGTHPDPKGEIGDPGILREPPKEEA